MTVKAPPEREQYRKLTLALEKYKGKRGVLIAALQEAQEIFGHLPRKVMIHIANELTMPLSEVYSVVSFYSLFSTKPVGKTRIEICMGTACYVKGAKEIQEKFVKELGIEPGEMTPDGEISLATSRCVGACSAAPVILIGEDMKGNVTPHMVPSLTEKFKDPKNEVLK